jgi:hypothetical protein
MVTNVFGISRRVVIHRFSRDFSFDLFSFHQEKKKRTQLPTPLVVISPLSNVINEKSNWSAPFIIHDALIRRHPSRHAYPPSLHSGDGTVHMNDAVDESPVSFLACVTQ